MKTLPPDKGGVILVTRIAATLSLVRRGVLRLIAGAAGSLLGGIRRWVLGVGRRIAPSAGFVPVGVHEAATLLTGRGRGSASAQDRVAALPADAVLLAQLPELVEKLPLVVRERSGHRVAGAGSRGTGGDAGATPAWASNSPRASTSTGLLRDAVTVPDALLYCHAHASLWRTDHTGSAHRHKLLGLLYNECQLPDMPK
jgi:hypothetical protein